MKKTLILLFLFNSNITLANFAKVLVLKGTASKLLPGKMKAIPIKKGETLPEYTSILTYDKSFIRLQFPDKSVVNLGAASKMVVAQKKNKDGTVINFLKGVMRTSVDKENKDGTNKMLIKTRTAVMGIRGTKFVASYNPVNKNTALITVEGEVAIAKIDEKTAKDKVKSSMPDEKLLEKKLAVKEEVVEVKPGEFSGTTEETGEAIKSVKIAPEQFQALAKAVDSKVKVEEVYTEKEQKEAEVEGLKSGGLVDLSTGFYVPPKEDAEFDKTKGVFVATNEIGQVDKNGNYAAPEGVKLDALRGFVSKETDQKVATNDLNKGLKKKYEKVKIFNKPKEEKKGRDISWLFKWLPENYKVKFSAGYQQENGDLHMIYDESLPSPTASDRFRNSNLNSNNGSLVGISFIQDWTKYFSTSLNLSFFTYELHVNQNTVGFPSYERSVSDKYFQIGFHYNINQKMQLSALIGEVDNYTINQCRECGPFVPSAGVNADVYNIYQEISEALSLTWRHYVFDIKDWSLGYTIGYTNIDPRNEFSHNSDSNRRNKLISERYMASLNVSKPITKTLTLVPYLSYQVENIRYENKYNNPPGLVFKSVIKHHRKIYGAGTELVWDF